MAAKKGEKEEDDDGDEAVEEDISFVLITSCVKATLRGMAWHEAKRSEAMRSGFFPGKRLAPLLFDLICSLACFDFV